MDDDLLVSKERGGRIFDDGGLWSKVSLGLFVNGFSMLRNKDDLLQL